MRFIIEINCENDAFGSDMESTRTEVLDMLGRVAGRLECGRLQGYIADRNGNTVGRFGFEE